MIAHGSESAAFPQRTITTGFVVLGTQRNVTRVPVAGVVSIKAVLEAHRGHEAWWTPVTWRDDRRLSENWDSAAAAVVDLDFRVPSDKPEGEHAPIPDDIAVRAMAALLPHVSLAHRTPRGLRVVFLFTRQCTDLDTWKAASVGAAAMVTGAVGVDMRPAGGAGLVVDPCGWVPASIFVTPGAKYRRHQRQDQVELGAVELHDAGGLAVRAPLPAVAEHASVPTRPAAGETDFDRAAEAFSRAHVPATGWGRPGAGVCPTCGHRECFGALKDDSQRWSCFSSSHENDSGGCGRRGDGCWTGDALDVEVHRRGLQPGPTSRGQILRDAGYLYEPRTSLGSAAEELGAGLRDRRAPRGASNGSPRLQPPIPYERPPLEVLPGPARALVEAVANSIDCDPAFVLLPVLATMSAAIGASRTLCLRPGQEESALLWFCSVGDSGSGKSPAMNFAIKPFLARERQARREHLAALRQYELALTENERAKHERRADASKRPEKPTAPRWFTADVTPEKVAEMLEQTPRGFLLARDELAGWFAFDRYARGKGAEQAMWLTIHSGQTLAVDRRDGTRILVERPFVVVTGTVQPGVLQRIVKDDPSIVEAGLLGRVLLAQPPTWQRRWNEDGVPARVEADWARFIDALCGLEMEPGGDDGELRPRTLRMNGAGKALWIEWFERAQKERELGQSPSQRAAWGKIESAAARLALMMHLGRRACDRTLGETLDEQSMTAGVRLAEWFGGESGRVYSTLWSAEAAETSTLFERVRRAIGDRPGITANEWAKRTRSGKGRDTVQAEAELERLVRAGVAEWVSPPPGGVGRPARRLVLRPPPNPETP